MASPSFFPLAEISPEFCPFVLFLGFEQARYQRPIFCKVFLSLLRMRFDTFKFLPYTLYFVRGILPT